MDWERVLGRFEDWWRRDNQGLPLMRVVARRGEGDFAWEEPATVEDRYLDVEYLHRRYLAWMEHHELLADGFPYLDANLGPGSLALYLGSEPIFRKESVWFQPCIQDLAGHPPLGVDLENRWWRVHLDMIRRAKELAQGRYLVSIPDIVENIDILAAMRDPQTLLFDLMDTPELVMERIAQVDGTYFDYYDPMYEIVRREDGVSCFTAFHILGKGKVAKVQCDFSAMISPGQFRQFVMPGLQAQLKRLDRSIYHLDGPDAIRHVPALMELSDLDGLQWTCGAGQPDGLCPRWDGIYDQVRDAGKALWIMVYDGGVEDWLAGMDRLFDRYGGKFLYVTFPEMSRRDADRLLNHAENRWTI